MAIALACAAVLSLWLIPALWLRLRAWGLGDLFLLSLLMNFGAFVFVDALTGEPAAFDAVAVVWVFLSVAVCALALQYAPVDVRLDETDWASCHWFPVAAVIAAAMAFRWYTYQHFADFDLADLADAESDLPYWYTSTGMLVSTTIFAGAIASWAKYRATRAWPWLGMTLVSALVIFGMGRRALLALLIVVAWSVLKGARGWKTALLLICAAPALLAMSNLYQGYRAAAYRGVVLEDVEVSIETAVEVERTIANLQEREPLWRFNHDLVRAHLEDRGSVQWGALLAGDLKNYVPSVLWPGKEWQDVEEVLLAAFQLDPTDRPSNIFAYTYADFGILGLIAAPAFLIAFIALVGFALRRLRDPFLRTVVVAMAIFYALNLEAGYLVPLALARDFIIVALVYVACRTTARATRSVVRLALAHQ